VSLGAWIGGWAVPVLASRQPLPNGDSGFIALAAQGVLALVSVGLGSALGALAAVVGLASGTPGGHWLAVVALVVNALTLLGLVLLAVFGALS